MPRMKQAAAKPVEVADHAAAEREQAGAAIGARGKQGIDDLLDRSPGLELLAVVEHDQADRAKALAQASDQAVGQERRDGGVADHDCHLSGGQRGVGLAAREQAGVDQDVVAAFANVDADASTRRRGPCLGSASRRAGVAHDVVRPVPSGGTVRERELPDDGIDQHLQRPAAGLDLERRGLAIERLALGAQLGEPRRGVGHLQQGPLGVAAQAVKQRLRIRLEVDAHRSLVQQLPIAPVARTIPPPVAMTASVPATSSSSIALSASRNFSSPSAAKKSRMRQPSRCSSSASQSAKSIPSCRASRRPTVDLPTAGRPIRLISTAWSVRGRAVVHAKRAVPTCRRILKTREVFRGAADNEVGLRSTTPSPRRWLGP